MKKLKGFLLLMLTTVLWGLAFTAQSTAADSISPFTFNTARCALASIFLGCVILGRKGIKKVRRQSKESFPMKKFLIGSLACGITVFLGMTFQQFGIAAYPPDAASSGRAGFLTATYVVMIPLVQRVTGKKLSLPVIFAVVCCVSGMYLLCMSGGFGSISTGDILVLLCAVSYTAYILAVDKCSELDGIALSAVQFLIAGVLCAVGMFIFEKPDINVLVAAWLPIVYTGVASSGIGYTLQILGQKYTEPAVASIIMSLESVFAAVFGWLILGEILSPRELFGCALVLIAVIAAQIPDMIGKKPVKKEK